MPIATVNPANGETLRTFDALDGQETERRLAAADRAFRRYRTTGFAERARLLTRAADLLDEDRRDIARIMTTEMGKPVGAARAEAAKCARAMRWYAAGAERLLADEHPTDADVRDSGASRALVRYRPLGVVLAGSCCIDFSQDLTYSGNAFEINYKASSLIFQDAISSK